jgi:GGDEF domain-containing protein/putative methionine-R-sulfoxide reductase with GAF domain
MLVPKTAAEKSLSSEQLQQVVEAQAAFVACRFDLNTFMSAVVNRMQRLTGATGAVVELLDGDEMVYRAASGSVAPYLGLRLKAGNSLSGLCVREGEIMYAEDTAKDPRVDAEACKKVGAASMLVVPLFQDRRAVGVLKVVSTKTHAFDNGHVDMLRPIAGLLGVTLAQQLARAGQGSPSDASNGQLFRADLEESLAHNAKAGSLLALLFFELYGFDDIEKNYGAEKAELLLRLFSARITAVLPETDILRRVDARTFAIIREDVYRPSDMESAARNIISSARSDFDLGGATVQPGANVGIVFAEGKSPSSDDLISCAAQALAQSKAVGRGGSKIELPAKSGR